MSNRTTAQNRGDSDGNVAFTAFNLADQHTSTSNESNGATGNTLPSTTQAGRADLTVMFLEMPAQHHRTHPHFLK